MRNLQLASLLFAFLEIRDRWSPVVEVRASRRNRVNSQSYLKGIIMARTTLSDKGDTAHVKGS